MNHTWKRGVWTPGPNEAWEEPKRGPYWMKILFGCSRCGASLITSRYNVDDGKYLDFPPPDHEMLAYEVKIDCNEELVNRVMLS